MSKSTGFGKEQQYGETIDQCLTDLAVKVGTGVIVGGVFSLLFKRGRWPVTLGAGIGLGMAYTGCENRIRSISHQSIAKEISKPQVNKETIKVAEQPSLSNSVTDNKDSHNEIPKLEVENAAAS